MLEAASTPGRVAVAVAGVESGTLPPLGFIFRGSFRDEMLLLVVLERRSQSAITIFKLPSNLQFNPIHQDELPANDFDLQIKSKLFTEFNEEFSKAAKFNLNHQQQQLDPNQISVKLTIHQIQINFFQSSVDENQFHQISLIKLKIRTSTFPLFIL